MRNTIQEHLEELMANPDTNLCIGGRFSVRDFKNLSKVLNSTKEDFIIFNNAGGNKFEIIMDRYIDNKLYKASDAIKGFIANMNHHVYCYQVNGEQTILKLIR